MQPLQYDRQLLAAKDSSITCADAAARSHNTNTAIPLRPAGTELQNTVELRAAATETAVPKPDLDAEAEKHNVSYKS